MSGWDLLASTYLAAMATLLPSTSMLMLCNLSVLNLSILLNKLGASLAFVSYNMGIILRHKKTPFGNKVSYIFMLY